MSKARPVEPDPLDGYDPGDPAAEPPRTFSMVEVQAERSVLTALLNTPSVYDELADRLIPEDFGSPAHAAIYQAIRSCDAAGRPFDRVTVVAELERAGVAKWANRDEYVASLAAAQYPLESLDAHVEIVLDRALRRRMLVAARAIGTAAQDPTVDTAAAQELAEQQVFSLGQHRSATAMASMEEALAELMAMMATARTQKVVGVPTGIERLDAVTGGLRAGNLVVLAARPAMGKSVLALQIAHNVAATQGVMVPFFSYEMSKIELMARLMAAETGVPLNEIMRGNIPVELDRDWAAAGQRLKSLDGLLTVVDKPPTTVTGIVTECRRMARRGPLGAVVVDYLQLLEGDGRRSSENRTQEVSFISRTLKKLADELEVPVIAVSQLSRAPEMRPNHRPMLSDLRESGSIEQDANIVLGLYRDWVYDKAQDPTHAELLILKNRQGPLEEIALDFQGAQARFRSTNRQLVRGAPAAFAGGSRRGGTDLF
jgi:replicative DNA helicase